MTEAVEQTYSDRKEPEDPELLEYLKKLEKKIDEVILRLDAFRVRPKR